jgi:hypothetical protein
MRTAFLFAAVAALAFFVTVGTPARPQAGFHADFDPAMPADAPHLSLWAPQRPVEPIRTV